MVILSGFWPWAVLIDNVSQKSLEFGSCASKYINANSKVNTALSPRRLGLNLGNNFIMNVVYYSSLKKWVGCSDESLPNSFKPAVLLTKTGFYRGENLWLYLLTASTAKTRNGGRKLISPHPSWTSVHFLRTHAVRRFLISLSHCRSQ